MKKLFLTLCALSIVLPVFSADYAENVKYMNQSQGFAGFNKRLPQANEFKELKKPTKITKDDYYDDFLDEFDSDGFRKEKPVSTEKKVIKHIKDYDGKTVKQYEGTSKPMTYDLFPKSFDDANNMMMPVGLPAMF